MRERSSSTGVTSDAEAEDGAAAGTDAAPPSAVVPAPPFVTGGHALLFEDDAAGRCDICGIEVVADPDDGSSYSGSALYISVRGDRVVYDEPPLCAACAVAVGVTALARWDIEEEEG